jgi:uncharacterized RDD family membrane protein YckC
MENPNKPSVGLRIGAMALDYFIMSIIAMLFFIPMVFRMISTAVSGELEENPMEMFSIPYLFIACFGACSIYLKDSFAGRSPAKRILGLQIINEKTNLPAGPLRCFARNLFIIMWPVEFIMALINPEKRLGDYVAGTRLQKINGTALPSTTTAGNMALTLLIAAAIAFLFCLPMLLLSNIMADQNSHKFSKSSYNATESGELQSYVNDSLSAYGTAEIKVYDMMSGKAVKYIDVAYTLNDDYLSDDDAFEDMQTEVSTVIYSHPLARSCEGSITFEYTAPGTWKSRSVRLSSGPQ